MNLIIFLVILVAFIAYSVAMYFYQRKLVQPLAEEEFRAGYRKAQLIDIREPDEYKAGHILGSRNIPFSQLRMRYKEIRADQPVYMYCQNGIRTGRAGQFLKRKGYKSMYQLQGGFRTWSGKVRKKD
ncbi:rhodanese-like domain-containing protein [Ectobacillus ponti]|uniref:Rhodanese-like domain-containing protein n=1 Tax=Ectobacillus ponti TaxID=2961894 RepID=A0AA41X674_9BACI|nr:rhodanese-like domain-containing protein [Ectobacillus ponti]MCP8967080.1 rhodanese-like domain-containing protein [Ectobacillus ponti]